MTKPRKTTGRTRQPKKSDALPAPQNYVFYDRGDTSKDTLTTTLWLAAEALVHRLCPPDESHSPATHAAAKDGIIAMLVDDVDGLLRIIAQIRDWSDHSPNHRELLSQMVAAYGDGEILKALFCRLFPDQPVMRHLDADSRPILSDREVEILREAAGDRSHEEIAETLGISPQTVNAHFKNIYAKLEVKRPLRAAAPRSLSAIWT